MRSLAALERQAPALTGRVQELREGTDCKGRSPERICSGGKSSRVVEQQQWEMVRQGQSLEDTEVTMRCMVLAGGATVRWYGSYAV